MYIPKLERYKEYYKEVKIYDKNMISAILIIFLTKNLNINDIESIVLKEDFKGYRVLRILKYFGLRDVHKGIFANESIKGITERIDILTKEDYQYADLYSYIKIVNEAQVVEYLTTFYKINSSFNIELAIDKYKEIELSSTILSKKDLEAYYNTLARMRNPEIQSKFRNSLIQEFDSKCAICEINKLELLIASHIVPYSRCQENISLAGDSNNGLLLCPTHDALFEMGIYISFNCKGEIIISKEIPEELYKDLNINQNIKIDSKFLTKKRKEYLKVHNNFFLKHK